MCGLCGIVEYAARQTVTAERVSAMVASLNHRGPDQQQSWVEGQVGLGHARLCILDLSTTGNQPMKSADGRFVIVYNGEVYNYRELREELLAHGVCFRGTSDTEVILESYARWGVDVFPRFNGVFAMAIWDRSEHSLLLARDRYGVKPLYYCNMPWGIVFGSEIKALLVTERMERKICPAALHEYAIFGVALGRHTMFQSIYRLEPGRWIRFTGTVVTERQYWKPEDVRPVDDDFHDCMENTRHLLEAAVRRQLISDVPVGIFLSGGIDSSAITAYASKHYGRRINTYSVGFDYDLGINELPKARKVADLYSTDHHEMHVRGADLPRVIERLVKHHDEPFADAANIPLFLLCQELQGGVKVVLTGDGGDEVFAGYQRYALLYRSYLWRTLAHFRSLFIGREGDIVTRLRRILDAFAQKQDALMMASLLTLDTSQRSFASLLSLPVRERISQTDPMQRYGEMADRFASFDPVQKMLYTDMCIKLPDCFLEKVDKATMAHGIEARVPFLDNDLSAYAMGVPSSIKMRGGIKKCLLKQALRGIVPEDILNGPKTGFGVPVTHWLKTSLYPYMEAVFEEAAGNQINLFDEKALKTLMREHKLRGNRQSAFILWKALNFSLWMKQYNVAWA